MVKTEILSLFLLLIVFSGCDEKSLTELRSEQPVLTGIMVEGSSASKFRFFLLTPNMSGQLIAPESAEVSILDHVGVEWSLQQESPAIFSDPDQTLLFESGNEYVLRAKYAEGELSAIVSLPAAVELLSLSNTQFTVEPDEPGASAFQFSWENQTEYSYVITVQPLDENPLISPFYPSTDFENQFGFPILEGQAILRASHFNYLGLHEVTIFAIDKAYEAVFFFNPVADIRSYLNAGPDNVSGGHGFVTGVSKTSFIVEILE
jgi:hypothetical protein